MDTGELLGEARKRDLFLDETPDLQNPLGERELFFRQARALGFSVRECERLVSLYFRPQIPPFR
jgi:hypothetical protein